MLCSKQLLSIRLPLLRGRHKHMLLERDQPMLQRTLLRVWGTLLRLGEEPLLCGPEHTARGSFLVVSHVWAEDAASFVVAISHTGSQQRDEHHCRFYFRNSRSSDTVDGLSPGQVIARGLGSAF